MSKRSGSINASTETSNDLGSFFDTSLDVA